MGDPSSAAGRLLAPAVAGLVAAIAVLSGIRGVDLAAATYRVELFRQSGLTPWDSQWYGGHWTFDYTVLLGPIAGTLGIGVTEVLSAVVAAFAFDRLATRHLGARARPGALIFAVGTLVPVAIGQVPFLLGEALALGALAIATTRLRWAAPLLALASTLASPLAGAFLGLAAFAWLAGTRPLSRRCAPAAAVLIGALAPLLALELLFRGQGRMPFSTVNFVGLLVSLGAVLWWLPRCERVLRIGTALYALAVVAAYAVPSALGANVTRLALAGGLAVVAAVPSQRGRLRPLLVLALLPLALQQWRPPLPALAAHANASIHRAYFGPLLAYLDAHRRPLGRVEVVPTSLHWEAAFVAPDVALARGWERQLDTADNPLFYARGALSPTRYRAWLRENGVRYVALPDVTLDYAGRAEGALIARGVPGLREVWHGVHWRLYALAGAPGILSGPATLLRAAGSTVVLHARRAGAITVRVRYTTAWRVSTGPARLREAPGGWLLLRARAPGLIRIEVKPRL